MSLEELEECPISRSNFGFRFNNTKDIDRLRPFLNDLPYLKAVRRRPDRSYTCFAFSVTCIGWVHLNTTLEEPDTSSVLPFFRCLLFHYPMSLTHCILHRVTLYEMKPYLIFVTGTAGGAYVNFFCQV